MFNNVFQWFRRPKRPSAMWILARHWSHPTNTMPGGPQNKKFTNNIEWVICIVIFKKPGLINDYEVRGLLNKVPDFFVWALLLIVRPWNSSPFRSNLLRLQCPCCTVPTTSRRPYGSPLVWTCQWSSPQPLSSPQLSLPNCLILWA